MATIKKIPAVITGLRDLTPTARVITLTLSQPLPFIAGSFVNLFIKHNEAVLRRAFSISSSDQINDAIDLSIRLNPAGVVSPLFWEESIIGTEVEVMGPLGLNTADKMKSSHVYLFGFGIGAGVVKSLAEHFVNQEHITKLTIMTGNRSDADIVHFDFFTELEKNPKVSIHHIVSNPTPNNIYPVGYIQNHLEHFDFNNSDVYVCGQEVACTALVEAVQKQQPENCLFFIEGFH